MLRAALLLVALAGPGVAAGAGTAETPESDGELVWRVGRSTFRALPEQGARLLSWERTREDGSVRPVIHHPPGALAEGIARARGGIPILFPFAGPSETDGRKSAWRDAKGAVRPMPMHGLARQGRFAVSELTSNGFSAIFRPGPEAEAAYPFRYRFEVRYRFADDRLVCELELANEGPEPLPWAGGLHPYFAVPWLKATDRTDYQLDIPATCSWRRAGAGVVPGPAPRFPRPLGDPALRQVFWGGLTPPEISFGPTSGGERIRLTAGLEPGGAGEMVVIVWTEDETSPFFCVEPFMGPTNAAETGRGLHLVPPGGRQVFRVEIGAE